jgi:aminomethyltransferase
MKTTALTNIHKKLGAKMVEFAGYEMPVQYEGVTAEHLAVRNAVGVFDVSHMGEFHLKGEKALDLVQWLTSNDASTLYPGRVQYSCMPNDNGGIVDDLLVYKLEEDEYMLVVNASNIEKDWNWINSQNNMGVEITDLSDEMSLLAVQGPKAVDAIKSLTDLDVENMKYYTFAKGKFAGKANVIISATGYTGSGGFEIYMQNEDAEAIWEAVMKEGQKYGIKPCGLAARDTLRLEMGFCLYGNDINDHTSPIEAGLGWITKTGKDFVGKDIILKHRKEGVEKKLVGFEMLEKAIPRHGYEIKDLTGNIIGEVTSGTMSPSLNKGIGMGYVRSDVSDVNNQIYIQIRKKRVPANIVSLPFYKV